jgi:hypothetical protein
MAVAVLSVVQPATAAAATNVSNSGPRPRATTTSNVVQSGASPSGRGSVTISVTSWPAARRAACSPAGCGWARYRRSTSSATRRGQRTDRDIRVARVARCRVARCRAARCRAARVADGCRQITDLMIACSRTRRWASLRFGAGRQRGNRPRNAANSPADTAADRPAVVALLSAPERSVRRRRHGDPSRASEPWSGQNATCRCADRSVDCRSL